MAINTLYPPVVDTYMPAFKITEVPETETVNGEEKTIIKNEGTCRIYFGISKYNDLGDPNDSLENQNDNSIRSVWISITNQYTNASVVYDDPIKGYKTGLIFKTISEDRNKDGDNKYYVEISHNDLKGFSWERGQAYKVQLRFCSVYNAPTVNSSLWITENSDKFSEWSSVCLIQGILPPSVRLNGFEDTTLETVLGTYDNTITGTVEFDEDDYDFLNSYSIVLYKQEDLENPIYQSDIIYTPSFASDEIKHDMECALEDGVRYTMKLSILSDKLYSETKNYDFLILDASGGKLKATITATPEDEAGRMKISIKSNEEMAFGNFVIRRASVKTNFTIWEDVKTLNVNKNEVLNLTWYDYTVEAGVWYKYCVQKRNYYGYRGIAVITPEPAMVLFDDMFLVGKNGQQLKIKFNPQISSYSHTLLESSIQTIGSKYPFIKRNGNVNYRQFSIAGLISHFMDEEEIFVNHNLLFYDAIDLYEKYNDKNRINKYNDVIYEREFRKRVEDFLNDGEIKLFKSNTEGNILVRLMSVSFTPEQQLGRQLYSFNANAIEIDDCTIKNLDKYNIQTLGTYKYDYLNIIQKEKQFVLSGDSTYSLADLIKAEDEEMTEQVIVSLASINDIEIIFEDKPYLINTANGELVKVSQPLPNAPREEEVNNNIVEGYIVNISANEITTPILVGTHGHYILKDKQLSNVNIIPASGNSSIIVKCKYTLEEEENLSTISSTLRYYLTVGQDEDLYIPTDKVIADYIYPKYNSLEYIVRDNNYNYNYQKLYGIDKLSIEAEPNTVFYLLNDADKTYRRYMIGETGFLNFGENDYYFTDLSFVGTHLIEKYKNINNVYINEPTDDLEFEYCYDVNPATKDYFANPSEIEDFLHDDIKKNGVYIVKDISDLSFGINDIKDYNENNYLQALHKWHQPEVVLNKAMYRVIYYRDTWYLFNAKNQDVIHPVYGILTYYGELERGGK